LRGFLDRDFIRTVEDMLFCVVGGVHPVERVIAYLKYVPSREGRWGGDQKYSRTMPTYTVPSLLKNIDLLAGSYPQYVFNSRAYSVRMSAVPKKLIKEHYCPERKLEELIGSGELDALQDEAVRLVAYLSDKAGVSERFFGVTGSVLLNIHKPEFSDIDLLVYGWQNSLRVRAILIEEFNGGRRLRKQSSKAYLEKLLQRWTENYPLTLEEAGRLFERRWSYGFFMERAFSLHPVKTRDEISEKYGDKIFTPEGIVTGRARIIDASDGVFLPCTYGIDGLKLETGKAGVEGRKVTAIVSYDGFYAGLFNDGDRVEVKGKLERVSDRRNGETGYRILVGSPEAYGRDYIKPV